MVTAHQRLKKEPAQWSALPSYANKPGEQPT